MCEFKKNHNINNKNQFTRKYNFKLKLINAKRKKPTKLMIDFSDVTKTPISIY